ncbi:MAG: hypothetical protein K2H73_08990 [Treponemataceae bacterium]|nr:hypothetical protein [Treponemataceae bacterium]
MKKLLFVVVALLITLSFVFANERTERIIDNFWNKGQVVKWIDDDNTINYGSKSIIKYIAIGKEDNGDEGIGIEFLDSRMNVYYEKEWNISSDSSGNIVLKRK